MNNKNYSVLWTVIIVSSLLIFGAYAYRQLDKNKNLENNENQVELIGGQRDEHDCLIAAGYSWCEAKGKCLREWEESCSLEVTDNDFQLIKQAFSDKYDRDLEEILVTVEKFTGDFARGSIKFAVDGEFNAGGLFLAYKENGVWKLAFDGNGMYSCQEMEAYNFPTDMILGCYEVESVESNNLQLANPASVYCQQQGGRLEIRTDATGGQQGICLFPGGKECEEWAFFRGECQSD